MSPPSDLSRLLGDAIRFGTIASVDHANATCTVLAGEIVTPEICWLAFRAGGTTAWSPPTVGEQCVLLCPEGDAAAGVALLGIYSNANPAPSPVESVDLIRYADGAEIAYDAKRHWLEAKLPAGSTVAVTADRIELKADVVITGSLGVSEDISASGKITAAGDVRGDGVSLKGHKHTAVQSGSAQSGPPA